MSLSTTIVFDKCLTVNLVYSLLLSKIELPAKGGHNMTIKDVKKSEQVYPVLISVFMKRKNLLSASLRNESNGYRDYSKMMWKI